MKLLLLTLLCVVVVTAERWRAMVTVSDPQGKSNVHGTLHLTQEHGGCVHYSGAVTGLTPGLHGFHVHELTDISASCVGAGSHLNPENKNHGGPNDHDRHVGDLGNIEAGRDGVANVNITDCITSLHGEKSIMGRTVVVHADEDDHGKGGFSDSLTTGHAGGRLACGIIQQVHGH